MKKFYSIFIALLMVSGASAQTNQPCSSCLPEGITFSTQAQIDNFQVNYPNCTEIEGNVKIWGNDITNLNGLNVLTFIGGIFSIDENDALTSLTGLNNLTSIGGGLLVGGNAALTSLTGLEGLTSIGGKLWIYRNTALTSLTGLEGLTSIGGSFIFGGNNALVNLSGLNNLTSIGDGLYVGLYIPWNPYLANPALTSLTGLENLTSIGGQLHIQLNDVLTSLTGLENLTSIGGNVYISNNISLSTCDVQSICNYLASPNGTIEIHDNAAGCNSQEEVVALCAKGIDESAAGRQQMAVSCYPNPTSGIVDFRLSMADFRWASLKVYNAQGQEVAVVLDEALPAGEQTVRWDAGGLPAGIYFYRISNIDNRQSTMGKIVKY
jgi:hypothetical protein